MTQYVPIALPPVDAILFKYSDDGIKELIDFCGDSFISCHKNRNIDSVGYATVKYSENPNCNQVVYVYDGIYLIKHSGVMSIMSANMFLQMYRKAFS